MPRKFRVFLDTSTILAGLNSPTGAAGVILAACFSRELTPIISPQVIEEAERNIPLKFPELETGWHAFLMIPPEVTPPPSPRAIRRAYAILPTDDAPILASAVRAKPDALITWNTRHFLRREVMLAAPFPILRPGEFIKRIWRKNTRR